jgi:hypothetical protein
MMDQYWFLIISIGVLIIIVLGFYAGKLLKQLSQQTLLQKQALVNQQKALNKHDKKVLDSVLLITRAMQQKQCEFDEGCWRLSVLLASLKTMSDLGKQFPSIFGLYEIIKDFAILDARKTLTKKQRMREDFQRIQALNKMHDGIITDLTALHIFTTEALQRLTPEPDH